MSDVTMSSEQLAQFEKERAEVRGQTVALAFMRKHVRDFEPCVANSELLGNYIKEHNLPWDENSLEEAFAAVKDSLAPSKSPEPTATLEADPLADAPLPKDWPSDVPFSTRADIRAMDGSTYRLFYHSRKSGEAFRNRVNLIQQRGL